jgi:hypothetical protein
MLRLSLALALAASIVAGIAGQANAANSFIVLRGCARWAPPACTIMNQGGQTYSLVGASPPVPLNVGVDVTATKSGEIGICFAASFKVIKWKRNKMRCPL